MSYGQFRHLFKVFSAVQNQRMSSNRPPYQEAFEDDPADGASTVEGLDDLTEDDDDDAATTTAPRGAMRAPRRRRQTDDDADGDDDNDGDDSPSSRPPERPKFRKDNVKYAVYREDPSGKKPEGERVAFLWGAMRRHELAQRLHDFLGEAGETEIEGTYYVVPHYPTNRRTGKHQPHHEDAFPLKLPDHLQTVADDDEGDDEEGEEGEESRAYYRPPAEPLPPYQPDVTVREVRLDAASLAALGGGSNETSGAMEQNQLSLLVETFNSGFKAIADTQREMVRELADSRRAPAADPFDGLERMAGFFEKASGAFSGGFEKGVELMRVVERPSVGTAIIDQLPMMIVLLSVLGREDKAEKLARLVDEEDVEEAKTVLARREKGAAKGGVRRQQQARKTAKENEPSEEDSPGRQIFRMIATGINSGKQRLMQADYYAARIFAEFDANICDEMIAKGASELTRLYIKVSKLKVPQGATRETVVSFFEGIIAGLKLRIHASEANPTPADDAESDDHDDLADDVDDHDDEEADEDEEHDAERVSA